MCGRELLRILQSGQTVNVYEVDCSHLMFCQRSSISCLCKRVIVIGWGAVGFKHSLMSNFLHPTFVKANRFCTIVSIFYLKQKPNDLPRDDLMHTSDCSDWTGSCIIIPSFCQILLNFTAICQFQMEFD